MARMYANENFPLPVVHALREMGHDVLAVQESGLDAAPDEQVLAFAIDKGLTLLTINRKHFFRLHNQSSDHAGMVLCTFDPDFARQARRIHEAIEPFQSLQGQVLRVNRPSL